MSALFEIIMTLFASTAAITVSIAVWAQGNASTHALLQFACLAYFIPVKYMRYTHNPRESVGLQLSEMLADFGLLSMLALEVFRESIPDSNLFNHGLAAFNILFGSLWFLHVCRDIWRRIVQRAE